MAEKIKLKRIRFSGNEEEDIKRMCACKEFVDDLKVIGYMKNLKDINAKR